MGCRSFIAGLLLATGLARAETAPLVADVIVNGQAQGVAVLLQDPSGTVLADEETLERWRVRPPWPAGEPHEGRLWHPIDAIAGLERRLDPRTLTLQVTIPPELFATTRIGGDDAPPLPARPPPGAFLDYDFGYFTTDADGSGVWSMAANPTLFGPAGYLSSGLLWRRLESSPAGSDGEGWLRLDTTWTTDFPARAATLQVGDAVTGTGAWRRGVRFGGFHFATNFETRPRLATFPQPSVRGLASQPTTLEILLNGEPRGVANLPPGGWTLEDMPVATGAGELTVIARDLSGREQRYTLDFYASRGLLRSGLSDYSLSLGRERLDFGLENFAYGDPFAAAGWRRGLTERLTAEAAVEVSSDWASAGGGVAAGLPGIGLVSSAIAVSRDPAGTGTLWQAGFERRSRRLSVGFGLQQTTAGFRQLGYAAAERPPRRTLVASGGFNLGYPGAISLTFASQASHTGLDSRLMQLNWVRGFGRVNVNAFVRAIGGQQNETSIGMVFSMPLGARHAAGASLQSTAGHLELASELSRDLPADDGIGYRLRSIEGQNARQEGYLSANAGPVRLDGDFRRGEAGTGYTAFASGSFAWLRGPHLARRIRDSFAVVDANGLAGVRVYRENQEVGRTDATGHLLVPGLRPFDINRLSIDATDLPMDAKLDGAVRAVVPFGRSGMLVDFDVVRQRGATLRLRGAAGEAIPAGAVAAVPGTGDEWPVGYGGLVYLPDASSADELAVRWHGRTCRAALPPLPEDAVLPDLGEVRCH